MDRRAFVTGALGTLCMPALAQRSRIPGQLRIGVLSLRSPRSPSRANPASTALIEGLRERGYVEGRNLVIEWPDALGREDRLPELAAGLVAKQVDILVVVGPAPLFVAHKATKKIPIVMVASSADPVRDKVAVSFARPGGNVTGLTYAEPDRFKKQLEFLKTVVPRAARVAVLWDFDVAFYRRDWEHPLGEAARLLGLTIQDPVLVSQAADLPPAFETMKRRGVDAFIVAAGGFMFADRDRVAEVAAAARLPGIAAFKEFAQAGLLMSYGPDLPDINRRAAGFVDRIVKGAKPGDIPIELPNRFDLALNLRTAKALGLTVDEGLKLLATEIYR
jgi:putative ABC transport system substrate-binding protein